MCGIAGYTGQRPDGVLERMSRALVHRGPDEAGQHLDERAALAIRRLAIIDVADGHQPYRNEDATIHAVFNGEIYGFAGLRARLERQGHRFLSETDGEILVHLYEERGEALVDDLDGMFAFALWDARRQRLLLARDRLGKKPLYVARHSDGTVSFASAISALVADPKVARRPDPGRIAQYLQFGYVPSPGSALLGIEKLAPGCLMHTDGERVSTRRYWRLSYEPKRTIDHAAASDELDHRVHEAVRARLLSDVPLGAFLSGGIDSTLVVIHMAALAQGRVKTFSIGFDADRYDERPYAARAARILGTEHHEQLVTAGDLAEVLPMLVGHYGEPFADSSAIPTYYLARMARDHVTVALTGDGGDELFAGYERHVAARWAAHLDRLPVSARRLFAQAAGAAVSPGSESKSRRHRVHRFVRSLGLSPIDRYADWSGTLTRAERDVLAPGLPAAVRPEVASLAVHPLDQALAADIDHYLPDDLLTKVDVATMACSLEARSPLLDHTLVEWAAQLPTNLKQPGFQRKRLLRDVAGRRLDPAFFARPKMGFAIPAGAWLRDELRELVTDTLLDGTAHGHGWLDRGAVERTLREHLDGRRDHGRSVWTMLILELWHRQVVDAPPGSGVG